MTPDPVLLPCQDGVVLAGHHWPARNHRGQVIVNAATGVAARYYHRYARFLAGHGFTVLTYDYRGIGLSRPQSLRRCAFRWRDWGELDFAAAVAWAKARDPAGPLAVVGHSIGGFLPGFASNAHQIDRMLTVGAQYGYWGDYAAVRRLRLIAKWHLAMPALTAACGYFPGRRLGWLEDLPAGVAYEWSFRRARMEANYPAGERAALLARFAAVRAPILAVGVSDDDLAPPRAIRRGLSYYRGSSDRRHVTLAPADLGWDSVGHFKLFHDRHREDFWTGTVRWLAEGITSWPGHQEVTPCD